LPAHPAAYIAFLDSTDVCGIPAICSFTTPRTRRCPTPFSPSPITSCTGRIARDQCASSRPEPLADNALLHMVMRPFVHTMSCFVAAARRDVVAMEVSRSISAL
jgi:hypothetical protein